MNVRDKLRVVVAACLFTAACGYQFTPSLAVDEQPGKGRSFVYGRFEVESPSHDLVGEIYETMGLTLQCNDGKLYRLRFDAAQAVQVLQVEPSTCWVTEVLFAASDGHILGRRLFQRGMLDNMRLEAGRAYYLGDFFGTVRHHVRGDPLVDETRWSLNGLRDHYRDTTEDLFLAYPKLLHVPTVNQLALGAKPPMVEAP